MASPACGGHGKDLETERAWTAFCVRPSTRRVAIGASDRESGSTCRRQEKRRCRRRVLALTFSPLSCQSAVPPSEKEWQRRE